jgi:NAD(P)-dependent dehydrogenase (short-subunit alcohol dehydrogenase family)
MRLEEKVALITGGTGGIGFATAKAYLKEGAKVMLTDLSEAAVNEAVKQLNSPNVKGMKMDVSSPDDILQSVQTTINTFGRIDILFANAGIEGIISPIDQYPDDMFQKVFDINIKGVFRGIKAVWPHMKAAGKGSIIITSSVAGLIGSPNLSAYVMSKHGVLGLMRTAAAEGAPLGIRVNSIHPGPIENRMMRSIEEGLAPGAGDQVKAGFSQMIPMKRYGTNEEVAHMAVFLGSDESSYSTGSTFVVDGGLHST